MIWLEIARIRQRVWSALTANNPAYQEVRMHAQPSTYILDQQHKIDRLKAQIEQQEQELDRLQSENEKLKKQVRKWKKRAKGSR